MASLTHEQLLAMFGLEAREQQQQQQSRSSGSAGDDEDGASSSVAYQGRGTILGAVMTDKNKLINPTS